MQGKGSLKTKPVNFHFSVQAVTKCGPVAPPGARHNIFFEAQNGTCASLWGIYYIMRHTCLFTRQKYSFSGKIHHFLRGLFVRHNCLFERHNCLFLRHLNYARNSNLRTSKAHFIKKSARQCTAATCDSLQNASP